MRPPPPPLPRLRAGGRRRARERKHGRRAPARLQRLRRLGVRVACGGAGRHGPDGRRVARPAGRRAGAAPGHARLGHDLPPIAALDAPAGSALTSRTARRWIGSARPTRCCWTRPACRCGDVGRCSGQRGRCWSSTTRRWPRSPEERERTERTTPREQGVKYGIRGPRLVLTNRLGSAAGVVPLRSMFITGHTLKERALMRGLARYPQTVTSSDAYTYKIEPLWHEIFVDQVDSSRPMLTFLSWRRAFESPKEGPCQLPN